MGGRRRVSLGRRAAATPNVRSRSSTRYAACSATTARCGFSSNATSCRFAVELREEGWTQRPAPKWAERATRDAHGEAARLFLFTKQRRYFFLDADTIAARDRSSSALCVSMSRQARRVQTCIPAREHERGLALIKRCILAGSSLLACRTCGAPYQRTRPGESALAIRRPTCAHNNPGGCCLVLDPFYDRAGIPTAEAALHTGRSFLGITEPADQGERR